MESFQQVESDPCDRTSCSQVTKSMRANGGEQKIKDFMYNFGSSRRDFFQRAFESGPCGWTRCPLVSKSIRSNGGPFCSQLIELPKRPGAYRLVEIL